jgi:tetratricopeptide (TPR) repeat protein
VNAQVPQGPGRGPRSGGDRDRKGGRDGRPGGGKGRRDDRAPSSGGHRVVVELSTVEKALGKADLAGQLKPLDEVVRQLRALRVKALAELEPNARGRLITTLLRVSRQTRPAEETPAPGSPPAEAEAPGPEAPPAAAAPAEEAAAAVDAAPEMPPGATEAVADSPVDAPPEAEAPAEPTAGEPQAAAAAPTEGAAAPAPERPAELYRDVLYRVGLAWLAVHEAERAENAFTAAGRKPSHDEISRAEAPPIARPEPATGPRKPGTDRGVRKPRDAKPPRGPRERVSLAPMPQFAPGEWQAQAEAYASRGRTRDAARVLEKHGAPAEALKLYQAGGDTKGALRAALAAKDLDAARRLAQSLPAAEARSQLERAEAWELLMELLVKSNAFDEVAKLYERARQFDQAALAWERAGKLGLARKAYEKVRDSAGADRVRSLEVQRLVERGDRLGAAQVLVQSGRRADAVEVLRTLPPTKAFRFMDQLKLKDEARALGEAELEKSQGEGKAGPRARWLDLLGRKAEAAQAWEEGGRKDRAYPLLETLGAFGRAAEFAEASGHRDQAIRLYRRAGDDAAAERLEATPPSTPPPAPAEDAGEAAEDAEHQALVAATPAEEAHTDAAAEAETSSGGTTDA